MADFTCAIAVRLASPTLAGRDIKTWHGAHVRPLIIGSERLKVKMVRVAPRVNRSIEDVGMRHTGASTIARCDAMHQMTVSVHNSPSRECYFRGCYLAPIALNLLGRSRQVSSG
jgi:hypothetical protein